MAGPLGVGEDPESRAVLRPSAAAVAVSTITVLPLFLTAALAVQVGADLEFSAAALGAAPAAFFGAGAVVSPFAGAIIDRLGALKAMRIAVLLVAILLLLVSTAVYTFATLLILLTVAGAINALTQPATNLYVAQRIHADRQGAAYGAKYSAIPMASLLAGLAVPFLGLTIGWRWAFAVFAIIAAVVALAAPGSRRAATWDRPDSRGVARLPRNSLLVLALGAGLAAGGGSSLAIFMVAGGVNSGLSEASAGLLFAAASGLGIAGRIFAGVLADRRGRFHLEVIAIMLLVGAVGVAAIATGNSVLFMIGAPLAFGAGWGWPGLFVLAVVQLNPSAPAAATGLTQTGTSVGCVLGPLLFGLLADNVSYTVAWSATGAMMVLAALVLISARRQVRAHEFRIRPSAKTDVSHNPSSNCSPVKVQPVSHRSLVENYFAACSRGDASAVTSHFCEDAVIYDTNHKPVRGATQIGQFYANVREQWGGAVWEVNTYVGNNEVAAIEWSMHGHKDGRPFSVRGSEYYGFTDGLIGEIRQYWTFNRKNPNVGLRGFPYESQDPFAAFASDKKTN